MSNVIYKVGDIFISEGRYWIKLKNGRQRYHRYLMEEHLNRKLISKEIVHHKDGDKLNNDISNLQVMSQSEHQRIHQTGNHNKRNGRPNTKEQNEKIKQSNLGLKRSEKARANISKGKTGTKYTEEHKRNMSVAQKKRFSLGTERLKQSQASKKGWRLRKERGNNHVGEDV